MSAPIALQLYTLREALAKDFVGGIKKVADIGYVGVETAGFPGTTPQAARKLFDDLGLVVCSAHTQLPVGDKKNEILDTVAVLGCQRIICAALRAETHYQSLAQIEKTCDLVNEAGQNAAERGLSLGMHNHWWEFEQVEGRYRYQALLECLDPAVFFEIDTYWVKAAGLDPVAAVKEMGKRAPLLHIKDGPGVRGQPQVAVGEGVIDVPAVIRAGEGSTEWLIVELDECATDMLEAVEKSYRYLVGQGLARGNKKV
jgi:sugar phosphate isomerase/epimerase